LTNDIVFVDCSIVDLLMVSSVVYLLVCSDAFVLLSVIVDNYN